MERKQRRNGWEKLGEGRQWSWKERGRVGGCHCCSFQALEVEKEERPRREK